MSRVNPPATPRSVVNGFTLLEMMVALAVFGLAALALARLQAYSLRSAGDVETHSIARIVAHNVAAEALTDPSPPPLGNRRGTSENGGRLWPWTMSVQRTADARIVRMDIAVRGSDGGSPVLLSVARPVEQ